MLPPTFNDTSGEGYHYPGRMTVVDRQRLAHRLCIIGITRGGRYLRQKQDSRPHFPRNFAFQQIKQQDQIMSPGRHFVHVQKTSL